MTSIVELDNERLGAIESESVRAVLAEHYGPETGGDSLAPPPDPATLRTRLRAAAPALASRTDQVRTLLGRGACGVLVTNLGLAPGPLDEQRKAIFALSVLLGDVRWSHPVDHRVVWDVRKSDQAGSGTPRYSSFSENDREADYHTDASFARIPDRYFLLYCVRPAHCGGGETFLTDARILCDELEQTPEGRAAVRILSGHDIPMRVPKAFRKEGDAAPDGYLYSPIISVGPVWRFRRDKIEKGLRDRPEYARPQVRDALDTLYALLEARRDEFRGAIPADAALIVDNHVTLHGRTSFTDPGRHLLRARFHEAAG